MSITGASLSKPHLEDIQFKSSVCLFIDAGKVSSYFLVFLASWTKSQNHASYQVKVK